MAKKRKTHRTVCIDCGLIRYVGSKKRAKETLRCRKCHMSRISKLGAQAVLEKYGRSYLLSLVRSYRLNNPSSLEQKVQKAIVALAPKLGCEWEREHQWVGASESHWLVDFLLYYKGAEIAIEINGQYFHSQPDRIRKDKLKEIDAQLEFDYFIVITEEQLNAQEDNLEAYILQRITTEMEE